MPLTGCLGRNEVVANDPQDKCDHPPPPDKPYTDRKAAIFITEQSQAIDTCRALLGHAPSLNLGLTPAGESRTP